MSADNFDRDKPEPTPTGSVASLVYRKLEERDGTVTGIVKAPYLSLFLPCHFRLTLISGPATGSLSGSFIIKGDVSIDGPYGTEKETFEMIGLEGRLLSGQTFVIHEPAYFRERIAYVFYAAADLWHLLPSEARFS